MKNVRHNFLNPELMSSFSAQHFKPKNILFFITLDKEKQLEHRAEEMTRTTRLAII